MRFAPPVTPAPRSHSLLAPSQPALSPQAAAALCRSVESALLQNSLLLHYQPVVSLTRSRVVGVEALLRWNHPTLGVLAPGHFACAFDNPRLAAKIGLFVLKRAIVQAQLWLAERLPFGRLAINVVAADFASGTFADHVLDSLATHGVATKRFALEVTEGVFLDSADGQVSAGLRTLHDAGLEIAFDDFGTGFASLTHLKSESIDRLKIDRSFVDGLGRNRADASIVAAIVQLGRNLGKAITAEGVETAEQIDLLRGMGCDEFQGYALARPMPAADVPAFVAQFDTEALHFRAPSYAIHSNSDSKIIGLRPI